MAVLLQLALIDLVRSTGIKPDALIGISTGELTCAYIDGVVTAEQVMQVAYHTACWAQEANLPSASVAVVCKKIVLLYFISWCRRLIVVGALQ
jgi:acyl transferase domain-containing protein